MNNPFIITGRYVAPEFFCDREKETGELVSNIENWRNTVMISLRRMGKSGLIYHVFNKDVIKEKYETFFIDIYDTSSLEEFVLKLSKEITARLQHKGERFFEKFVSIVNSVKIGFAQNPLTGQPEMDFSLTDAKFSSKTLEQLFEFLEGAEKPCIVAIDEFQQIAEYGNAQKDIATLRTFVQGCKRTRFIFAGSNRRMMGKLFHTPSEPFFMSCSPIMLEAIEKEKYADFVLKHFNANNRQIQKETVNYVYEMFEGHTWFVQYVFNRLFEMYDGRTLTIGDANCAINYIIDIFAPIFQEIYMGVSERQKELLYALAKEGKTSSPTSVDFIKKYNLRSASAVQGALKPLAEEETISSMDGSYFITNRFYSMWLAMRHNL
ncbi:MAG: ATP-binding protein [Bacteroidales bacterium]|nr:ATP-binding protein [Bacteroidales bacterium]